MRILKVFLFPFGRRFRDINSRVDIVISGHVEPSAVQTPVLSPPAPAKKTPAPGKKTPAPAENFRLVQICQNWKFLQFKLETPSL